MLLPLLVFGQQSEKPKAESTQQTGKPQQTEKQGDEQQSNEKTPRVRAKEPTTVTVEGRADTVNTERSDTDNGVKGVANKTWKGMVRFGGWLMNTKEDIPADRERQNRPESASGSESSKKK